MESKVLKKEYEHYLVSNAHIPVLLICRIVI